MKEQDAEALKSVVENVIRKLGSRSPVSREGLLSAWESAAGENLCRHARPAVLRKKKLIIDVDSSAWFF